MLSRRFSIQFGATAAVCVALAVVAALTLLGWRVESISDDLRGAFDHTIEDTLRSDAEIVLETLVETSATGLLDYDAQALSRVAALGAGMAPGVRVRIFDHQGRLMADSGGGRVGTANAAPEALRGLGAGDALQRWRDDDSYASGRAVCVGGACLGAVEVTVRRAQIKDAQERLEEDFSDARTSFRINALVLCLLALALIALGAAGVGWLVGRRLQESIDNAVGALEAMRDGAREVKVDIRDAELEKLATALEDLAGKLADERERAQPVADNLEDGLFVAQPGGRIVLANPALHALLGAPAFSLFGQDAYAMLGIPTAEDAAAFAAAASEVTELRTHDGGLTPVLVSARRAGVPPDEKVVGMVRDGAPVQEAEKQLKAANMRADAAEKAREEFLAVMSHELRTPLNGVLGGAAVLAGTELTTAQRRFVSIVQESGKSMLRMVTDVLDFSRMQSGADPLATGAVDLDQLVRSAVGPATEAADAKGVALVTRVQPGLPPIRSDSEKLRQIVTILADNAAKFTEQGRVEVSAEADVDGEDARVSIVVRDTGPGVAIDAHQSIFESFRQGDGSASRPQGGAGLGLALGRKLAEALGGELTLESAPGEGAAFTFAFSAPLLPEEPGPANLQGARALVVAQDPAWRAALGEQLTHAGAAVASVATADEAVALLAGAGRADLVVRAGPLPDEEESGLRDLLTEPDLARPIASVTLGGDVEAATANPCALLAPRHATMIELADSAESALSEAGFFLRKDGLLVAGAPGGRPAAREGQAPEAGAAGGHGPMVLLADDNEVNRIVLTGYLRKAGYDCCVAPNGYEAVRLFREQQPRVVLIALDLPVMSGVEATRSIRSHEREMKLPETPVIGLVAEGRMGDRERGAAVGMTDYLGRPVKVDKLAEKLERWISLYQAGQAAGAEPAEPEQAGASGV
ncbi:ATP-binding protein [Rubrimonas cliftonensis]|uniref:histidine kinase n=1 Tax=Rubrimonas cliftonensis TaxID=89524 RepID=A0A1H4D3K1_9RHOB|nr:ATP-binding protein [Rubrimonas cliftonensis]SEA67325.1 Signal transduction histidine kinase [Rubrimonas cliftonensis]